MSALRGAPTGAALLLCAVFVFSLMDLCARTLTQDHPPLQVVWARYTSQTLISFLVLSPILHKVLRTHRMGLQLIRSAFLFGATCAFFTSFVFLDLITTTAIFQLGPIFIVALAALVLGEKVGPRRWAGVSAGLIGALVIIRPGTEVFSLAAGLPIVAALCYACYAIATRFLGEGESPWTSFLYTALIGTILSSLIVPSLWHPWQSGSLWFILAMGVLGAVGHYCLIAAFSRTEASLIAPLGYFSILFNGMWGFVVFAEVPTPSVLAGAVMIVAAGIYVWARERAAAAQDAA